MPTVTVVSDSVTPLARHCQGRARDGLASKSVSLRQCRLTGRCIMALAGENIEFTFRIGPVMSVARHDAREAARLRPKRTKPQSESPPSLTPPPINGDCGRARVPEIKSARIHQPRTLSRSEPESPGNESHLTVRNLQPPQHVQKVLP